MTAAEIRRRWASCSGPGASASCPLTWACPRACPRGAGARRACAVRKSRCWPTCPSPTTRSSSRAAPCGLRHRSWTRWLPRCGCPPPSGATCMSWPTVAVTPAIRPGARPGRRRPSCSIPPWPTWSSGSSRSRPWSRAAAGTSWRQPGRARAVRRLAGGAPWRAQPGALDVHHRPGQGGLPGVEPEARAMLGRFRLSAARYPDDPDISALIAELQRDSEQVRDWWPRHDVTAIGGSGSKKLRHAPARPCRVLPRDPPGRRPPRPDPGHLRAGHRELTWSRRRTCARWRCRCRALPST